MYYNIQFRYIFAPVYLIVFLDIRNYFCLGIPAAAEIIDLPADTKAGEVIIKWNTPKDNGATITQYTVYQRTVSDDGTPRNWIRLHTITAAVSVRQVAVKLDKGKIYEFVVTATNKRGESSKEEENIKRIKVGGRYYLNFLSLLFSF